MFNRYFTEKINKYGELNGYDILKNVAFLTMLVDHIGYFLLPNIGFLRIIGRISAPIFFLLFGYSYKNNKKRDRLLLLLGFIVIVVEISVDINNIIPLFNVLFSLYISGKCIKLCEWFYRKHFIWFILSIIFVFIPLNNIIFKYVIDYGFFSILLVFVGYLFKREERNLYFIITTIFIFISFAIGQLNTFSLVIEKSMVVYGIVFYILYIIYLYYYFFYDIDKYLNKIYKIKIIPFRNLLLFVSRNCLILYPIHIFIILFIKVICQL